MSFPKQPCLEEVNNAPPPTQPFFGLLTFRASPSFPKSHHEVVQILVPQGRFVQPLPVKRLTEPPPGIHASHRLQPFLLLLGRPIPVLVTFGGIERLPLADAARGRAFARQQGTLGALEEDLVVQARLGAPAKGDAEVHKVGELREPLVRLAGAHAPPQDGAGVGDAQVLGDEPVLGGDVVLEGDVGERGVGREVGLHVGGGGGLAVAEEGGDDDEVFGGGEGFVLADEPCIVLSHALVWKDRYQAFACRAHDATRMNGHSSSRRLGGVSHLQSGSTIPIGVIRK